MAERKTLKCVPGRVSLNCGMTGGPSSTTVRVKTSDSQANIAIRALGFNPACATVSPTEGRTNQDGYLDVTVGCQGLACPGDTTVTFDATGYDDDDVEVNCQPLPPPPGTHGQTTIALIPVALPRHLLAEYLGFASKPDAGGELLHVHQFEPARPAGQPPTRSSRT